MFNILTSRSQDIIKCCRHSDNCNVLLFDIFGDCWLNFEKYFNWWINKSNYRQSQKNAKSASNSSKHICKCNFSIFCCYKGDRIIKIHIDHWNFRPSKSLIPMFHWLVNLEWFCFIISVVRLYVSSFFRNIATKTHATFVCH